jgi:NifU-like protein involved in Fe-S cluster formation
MTTAEAHLAAADFERSVRSGEAMARDSRMAVLSLFIPLHDTPSRIGCATLPWKALGRALATKGSGDG